VVIKEHSLCRPFLSSWMPNSVKGFFSSPPPRGLLGAKRRLPRDFVFSHATGLGGGASTPDVIPLGNGPSNSEDGWVSPTSQGGHKRRDRLFLLPDPLSAPRKSQNSPRTGRMYSLKLMYFPGRGIFPTVEQTIFFVFRQ